MYAKLKGSPVALKNFFLFTLTSLHIRLVSGAEGESKIVKCEQFNRISFGVR